METFYNARRVRVNKLSPVVREIGDMHFEGNIVPHSWFQHPLLRLKSGAPNLVAIILLADLLYWHRPTVVRDEDTGEIVSVRDKFAGAKYRADYAKIGKRFGLSKRQVQDAATFLHERKIIERELVARYETGRHVFGNAVFLTPLPAAVRDLNNVYINCEADDADDYADDLITFESDTYHDDGDVPTPDAPPVTPQRDRSDAGTGEVSRPDAIGSTLERDRSHAASGDISKTTSKIASETSTHISIKTTADNAPAPAHAPTKPTLVSPPAAAAFQNVKSDEVGGLVALVMEKVGISKESADSIVKDALRDFEDGAEVVKRNANWWPESGRARTARSAAAVFCTCVQKDWAKTAADVKDAKQQESAKQVAQRRYVVAPSDFGKSQTDARPSGNMARLGEIVAQVANKRDSGASSHLTQEELDAIHALLSQCAKERLHKEAIEKAKIGAAFMEREIKEVPVGVPDSARGGAARLVISARNNILRERAASPIVVNNKNFYDADDARAAQIDLDFG